MTRNISELFIHGGVWKTPNTRGAHFHCFPSHGEGKSLCGRYRMGDRDNFRASISAPHICQTCLKKYREMTGNESYLPPGWICGRDVPASCEKCINNDGGEV